MKIKRHTLALALLAAVAAPAAHAEVAIDVIGGSEVSFEGLVQADGNWFENDLAKAREMHFLLASFSRMMFIETNPIPVKTALALMGRITLEMPEAEA